ncbi:MAG TPA: 3-phosphoshikimate 1-carboxyvinyltransferase [bacterium]|nr:3-phosphoshikimate 1-carboxyvinyltransferase [bacterium]HPR88557.1 3-phosphoshikimate 1-carboxyvinyltransferase [bacterium]
MADILIQPARAIQGNFSVPGDKSISHRALILAAMAEGKSTIRGLSDARDVASTRACLEALGIKISTTRAGITVTGKGKHGFRAAKQALDAGNSGSTIRMLAGVVAAQPFTTTLTGDDSLRRRPMRRIIEPLEQMGAHIESDGFKAPLVIQGGPLHSIDYASTVASAQVKSCILLAGLYANGTTRVTEPSPSRDHTERMLGAFGVTARFSQAGAGVQGPATLHACDLEVPGDLSSAAFFLVAASLLAESEVTIQQVSVNPTRMGICDALLAMGSMIQMTPAALVQGEPRADLTARSSRLHAASLGGSMIPRILDEIPILAVAATQAHGVTVVRDAGELRLKESDRLAAVAKNLQAMGANIRETRDGLIITGPTPLHGAEIESFGDHRIAMAFAIAGLIASGETLIKESECVEISFPGFFELLGRLRQE